MKIILLFLIIFSCGSQSHKKLTQDLIKKEDFKIHIPAPYFSYIIKVVDHYKKITHKYFNSKIKKQKISFWEEEEVIKVVISSDWKYIGRPILGGGAIYTLNKKTGEIIKSIFEK